MASITIQQLGQNDIKTPKHLTMVSFAGDLDQVSIEQDSEKIEELIGSVPEGSIMLFDFSNLMYINSRSISHLVNWYMVLEKKNAKLILFALRPNILDILDTTGITNLIPMFPNFNDVQSAIENNEITFGEALTSMEPMSPSDPASGSISRPEEAHTVEATPAIIEPSSIEPEPTRIEFGSSASEESAPESAPPAPVTQEIAQKPAEPSVEKAPVADQKQETPVQEQTEQAQPEVVQQQAESAQASQAPSPAKQPNQTEQTSVAEDTTPPAPLAGIERPAVSIPEAESSDPAIQQVRTLTELKPEEPSGPMTITRNVSMEDTSSEASEEKDTEDNAAQATTDGPLTIDRSVSAKPNTDNKNIAERTQTEATIKQAPEAAQSISTTEDEDNVDEDDDKPSSDESDSSSENTEEFRILED